jgi:phosphoglycerate kinase
MLARKLQITSIVEELKDQRVLMRADFNVPIKNNKIADLTRITSTVPTISLILSAGARSLVLMSHLGRPDGLRDPKASLQIVADELTRVLARPVTFLPDCVGPEVEAACRDPAPGSVFLLENLRFHPEEEGVGKDEHGGKVKPSAEAVQAFRNSLTSLGDVFVNDAFGTAHRAHSSMVGVNLPRRAAGLLMGKEIEYFAKVLENPHRPLLVIMGGAKVKDKIQLIMNLLDKCDEMIIGGGMAFTFLKKSRGVEIGSSMWDEEGSNIVEAILKKAEEKGVQIHLPVDYVCGDDFKETANVQVLEGNIPDGWRGLDIGPKSVEQMVAVINRANTVVWNGPPGVFEMAPFRAGSVAFFNAIVEGHGRHLASIVGGGDTANFVQSMGEQVSHISHISTGGGASLELMEGKELPGVLYLSDVN